MRSTNGWTASWRRRSPSPRRRNSRAPTKWRATSTRRPEEMRELKYWQAVNEALTEASVSASLTACQYFSSRISSGLRVDVARHFVGAREFRRLGEGDRLRHDAVHPFVDLIERRGVDTGCAGQVSPCLLYTSDAADDLTRV